MDLAEYIQHPHLSRFVKRIGAGEYIFQQGQLGNTMFIIVEGQVQLMGERDGEAYIAAMLNPGQFLGEKAILSGAMHQRVFGARTESATTVLELSLDDIEEVQKNAPYVMIDILKRVFQVAAERLDRANYLARVLRSSNNVERLIHCLIYFSRTSGQKVAKGVEIEATPDSIAAYIDMKKPRIEGCLSDLVARRLLIPGKKTGTYVIEDESALMEYIPFLRKQLAA